MKSTSELKILVKMRFEKLEGAKTTKYPKKMDRFKLISGVMTCFEEI